MAAQNQKGIQGPESFLLLRCHSANFLSNIAKIPQLTRSLHTNTTEKNAYTEHTSELNYIFNVEVNPEQPQTFPKDA